MAIIKLGEDSGGEGKKDRRIKPTLYDGSVISSQHVASPVFDDEETLILKETSHPKMLCNFVMNSTAVFDDVNVRMQSSESCVKCLDLDAELLNKQNAYNDLSKKYFENNNLKAHLQAKDTTICKLKEHIKSMRENHKEEKFKHEMDEIETINIELEHSVAKLLSENERLHKEIENLKKIYKDQFDSIIKTRYLSKEHDDSLIAQLNSKYMKNVDLQCQIQDKVFVITSLKNNLQKIKRKESVENAAQIPVATTIAPGMFKIDLEPLAPRLFNNREAHIDYLKHTQEQDDILRGIVKQAKVKQPLDSALDFSPNHTWGSNATDIPSSSSLVNDKLSRLFGNDQIAKIMGYGDYQLGNIIILRVYYVEGLGHNLFSVGQFCDADLEVAFRKNTCFIRNLKGLDLLSGSRDINLYTISLDNLLKTSPISKDGLARGILRLKFQKDYLCSACALGKGKKSSHQPKAEDTDQEKLYLLHMDLCGPMRVESINGKKDNGTEFVNQTLHDFYENVGISHQTSVARTPQQNSIAEAINTACYTQNRSLICIRYNKTPYELMHNKKPHLSFLHVFGSLCYPTNDSEDLGKLNAKVDIRIFVGYAPAKKAFRIYNRSSQKIMETIHVTFNELTAMAS
ncbi:integrase, catalytic region, zinc finger, CCHC-type containing protein [Tanacetum coccineum]